MAGAWRWKVLIPSPYSSIHERDAANTSVHKLLHSLPSHKAFTSSPPIEPPSPSPVTSGRPHSSRYWEWLLWHKTGSSPLPSCLPSGGGRPLFRSLPVNSPRTGVLPAPGQGVSLVLQLPCLWLGQGWAKDGEFNTVKKKRGASHLGLGSKPRSPIHLFNWCRTWKGWRVSSKDRYQNITGSTINVRNW